MNFNVATSNPAACVAVIDAASYQAAEYSLIDEKIRSTSGAAGSETSSLAVAKESAEFESRVVISNLDAVVWSNTMERRFCELAGLAAIDQLPHESEYEFQEMQALRRKLKTSPSLEESLHTYQRHKLEDEIMRAMERYVRYLKTQSCS